LGKIEYKTDYNMPFPERQRNLDNFSRFKAREMKDKIIIASQNPGKIREIQNILAPFPLNLTTAIEIGLSLTVAESGQSYQENALLKAVAYQQQAHMPALADDSGLEVDALNGAPGIYSARYSQKENANDKDRRVYLLEVLKNYPQPWMAHFHCSVVLAMPGGKTIQAAGRCDGIIIPEERGRGGFGYDPIFYIPEFDATMAELPEETKNKISHRARALTALIPLIEKTL
jgi:XTP/dITP diphosphohydrolase